jgi:two-component system NarL family sensor kinase
LKREDNPLKYSGVISNFDSCKEEAGFELDANSDSEQRFRALALAALENEQSERGKLARMLHDEVAQLLSGAGLQLDILRMDLQDRVPEIVSRTAEIQSLLERVVRHIRHMSYELNPDIVERAGLQPALDLLVGRFRRVFRGGLHLAYTPSVRIPIEVGVAMERIAEEAVDNAVQHANCDQIRIIVKSTRDGAALQVRDNGIGFDYKRERRIPRGLGLLMMDHCARKAGLGLSFRGHSGGGSIVCAVMAGQGQDLGAENGGNPV